MGIRNKVFPIDINFSQIFKSIEIGLENLGKSIIYYIILEKEIKVKMELRLGRMLSSELAEWFGVTPKTYSNTKKKKLQILSHYCKFQDMKNKGIFISEIYVYEYGGSAKEIVEEEFTEAWKENPNTIKNAAEYIYHKRQNEFVVKPDTVYHYTCQIKRDWFGVPKKCGGSKGYCNWIYAVYNVETNRYRYLTEEEQQIRAKLLKEFYKDSDARIEELAKLKESYKLGEISKEDYDTMTDEVLGFNFEGDWDKFNRAFEEAIHLPTGWAIELIETADFAEEQ